MLYNAKNGRIRADGADMDYISFGRGEKTLVIIPGVGDGLRTVKGLAVPFAFLYRKLAKKFTVYVFSRRNELPEGFSTRDMAKDAKLMMDGLGIASACVLGVSQGGMIAQYLAIDYPEKVEKLVLALTLSRPNDTIKRVVAGWVDMARAGDYKGIMLDTAERSYSKARLKNAQVMYSIFTRFSKPKSLDRFIVLAHACATHDSHALIANIACPTLVIGGTDDKIVTGEASRQIAKQIPASELVMYEGLGHAAYEEAKDFIDRVRAFCE